MSLSRSTFQHVNPLFNCVQSHFRTIHVIILVIVFFSFRTLFDIFKASISMVRLFVLSSILLNIVIGILKSVPDNF